MMKSLPSLVSLAVALGTLGVVAASPQPAGPGTAFAVAALVACTSRLSLGWSLMALSLVVGEVAPVPLSVLPLAATLAFGLALGALTRALKTSELSDPAKGTHLGAIGVMSGVAILVIWLPDARLLLETSDGSPLMLSASVQRAEDGTFFHSLLRASADQAFLDGGFKSLLSVLVLLPLGVVAWARAQEREGAERIGRMMTVLAGALLWAWGVAAPLLTWGETSLVADAEAARLVASSLGDASLIVTSIQTPEAGFIGWSSRPVVDVLRLIGGLTLIASTLRAPSQAGSSAAASRTASPERGWAALALVAACVCLPSGGPGVVALAALLLTLVGAFVGTLRPTHARLPHILNVAALCCVVFAVVGPVAGWMVAA